MSDMMQKLKIANSAVRTGIAVFVLGGVGYGSYLGYDKYVRPGIEANQAKADLAVAEEENESLRLEVEKQAAENEKILLEKQKMELSLKLIKLDRRLAEIEIVDKGKNDEGVPFLDVRFKEMDRDGNVVGAEREYTLLGERVYVDGWIVSFEDKYIEGGDELRGKALCILKGIYGEIDGPLNAKPLDSESNGPVPGIYKSDIQNAFEEKIWADFWEVSNDKSKQAEIGIEAAYGQANYLQAEKGKRYRVELHASGGCSIKPLGRN